MKDIRELLKEAREAAHYADEYAGERELWTRVADALEAQAKEIEELKKELNAWHESANCPEKSPGRMRARIAELEAALERICDTDPDDGTAWFHEVARAALNGEKA